MLRVRRGEELRVRLINELVADTTMHWHGVRVPNAMDGVAGLTQAAVAPGRKLRIPLRAAGCRNILVPFALALL